MVGHQPTFFHPGILSKFIAAAKLAKQVDGVVVFLVVDHHKGDAGTLEMCSDSGHLAVRLERIANMNPEIAMQDQPRCTPGILEPFSSALTNAQGNTVAMQFAHALVECMAPYAQVDYVLPGSALLDSSFGKTMVHTMQTHSGACIDAYNSALDTFPHAGISFLEDGELPLWQGNTNDQWRGNSNDLRPKALTLTLLARLLACDLFVHGTGGYAYDACMEAWCKSWLGVTPCSKVMCTATLRLQLQFKTWADARSEYFSPAFDSETKAQYIQAIKEAPYGSAKRQVHFQEMRRWLDSIQEPLDKNAYIQDALIAAKRDWAFPLYSDEQLQELVCEIESL